MWSMDTTSLEPTTELCADRAVFSYGVTMEAVARLNRLFDRRLRDECGISLSWFEALLRIGRSGGSMTMSELASQLALTNGGITRMVDRMADAGYVERRPCEEDRRVSWAVLTDSGRAKWDEAAHLHLDDLRREFTDRMSARELETIVDVMDRLRSEPAHS